MTHLKAPLVPSISSPFDISNFEEVVEEDELKVQEENSGWDLYF